MPRKIQITLSPREAAVVELLEKVVAIHAGCRSGDIAKLNILHRSVDARKRGNIKIILTVNVFLHGEEITKPSYGFRFENVRLCPEVVIAGTGPAGLFAALLMFCGDMVLRDAK